MRAVCLIFGENLKPILQGIFSCSSCEFIHEAFQRECHLQRINRPHPPKRDRSFCLHVFNEVIGNRIYRPGLIGQIGVDSIGKWLPLLSADGRRNDAMRQAHGKT
jgi:hypothetical protein